MTAFLPRWRYLAACGALAFALLATDITSAQEVSEIPFFNAPTGSAALGGGLRMGTSLYLPSDNEEIRQKDLIPLYLYEGKYLFARGTSGGVHFFRNNSFEFNLYTRFRFQKLDPNSNAFYAGLEKREQSVDTGLELSIEKNWGKVRFDFVTDTLNVHQGQEARVSYRYRFQRGPWSISPYIGYTWQDEKLTNYYYGVSEAEANPERPAYLPGESKWLSFGLNTSWQIADRISLRSVQHAAANSG